MDYAHPLVRLGAFILDSFIFNLVGTVWVLGGVFLARQDGPDSITAYAVEAFLPIGLLYWALDYFFVRIARYGATPGMRWLGIQVVTSNGGAVGVGRAFGRGLMVGVINIFTLGLGHLVAFFDKQHRSLHDMICGTVVIKR